MSLGKSEIVTAVGTFFDQVEEGIISQVKTQMLPLIGPVSALPGVDALVTAFEAVRAKVDAVLATIEDTDPATEIADAINTLQPEGITAKVNAAGGIDITFLRQEMVGTGTTDMLDLSESLGSVLKISAQAGADLTAALAATLTVAEDGSFSVIGKDGAAELSVMLDGDLSFGATADLGVVAVDIKDHDPAVSEISATIAVDLADDLTGVTVKTQATAVLDLDFATREGGILPFQVLPDLSGQLVASIGTEPDGTIGKPAVGVKNVMVDLGSYLELVSDAARKVTQVFDAAPFEQLFDAVTQPLPFIGGFEFLDTIGNDDIVTLVDIAVLAQPDLRETIEPWYKAIKIINLLRALGDLDGKDVKIDIGDGSVANDPNSNFFDMLKDKLKEILPAGPNRDELVDYLTDFDSGAMAKQVSTLAVGESNGFSFGLLEDPTKVIDLLLGGDPVSLVEFDVPPLTFGTYYSEFFPIIGPLGAKIYGSVGATIDFDVGYDTRGFTTKNFFDGFYISTPEVPDTDPRKYEPIGVLATELGGGAGIGYGGGSFTVDVGFGFTLSAFLNGDNQGRYRLTEDGLDCIFNPIGGVATVGINARLEIDFGFWSFTKKFPIANTILGRFEGFVCPHPEFEVDPLKPGLATLLDNGDLRLNVGPAAKDRLIPDEGEPDKPKFVANADDPNTAIREDLQEAYLVANARDTDDLGNSVLVPGKLDVNAFGFTQRTGAGAAIIANFAEESDSLIIQADVLTPSVVSGGAGDDNLHGGAGRDVFYGEADGDVLTGNGGDDFLYGGAGGDQLSGGAGADLLDGGGDVDTVDYSGANQPDGVGITVEIDPSGNATGEGGEAEGDVLVGIENVIGTREDDDIRATQVTFNTYLEGGEGNDILIGGQADDLLLGGIGADTLIGGLGHNATSYITSWAAVDIDLTRGFQFGGEAQGDILFQIEAVQGTGFADTMVGDGADNEFDAGEGDDTLEGGAGKDIIDAGSNDDRVYAIGDKDRLNGGAGRDTLDYSKASGAVTLDLGATQLFNDLFDPNAPDNIVMARPVSATLQRGFSTFEDLVGTRFTDTLTGDLAGNRIEGGQGDDTVSGDGGDDTLIGGTGADKLFGGSGVADWTDYTDSTSGVTVDLILGGSGGTAQGDSYLEIENIRGSGFSDALTGDSGANVIDPFISGRATSETVDGRGGVDTLTVDYSTVEADAGGGVTGGLTSAAGGTLIHAAAGGGTLDTVTFTSVENLDFTGTRFADQIIAGAGDDLLYGGDGDDGLFAGTGFDRVGGGGGNDSVAYGISPFSDFARAGPTPNFFLDGGAGTDTLSVILDQITEDISISGSFDGTGEDGGINFLLASGGAAIRFERLGTVSTGSGDDDITQGGRVDNIFDAGEGDDTITSGLGRDEVAGSFNGKGLGDFYFDEDGRRVYELLDAEAFAASAGDALVLDYSGLGADQRIVSQVFSTDSFSVERFAVTGARAISPITSNAGFFAVLDVAEYGSDGFPRPVPTDLADQVDFTGIERLDVIGGGGNDVLSGAESAYDPRFRGEFAEPLSSATGDDRLSGGDGDDQLYGRSGDDMLFGGAGDDILVGGNASGGRSVSFHYDAAEVDTLTGGEGADSFVLGVNFGPLYARQFLAGDPNHAEITDFSAADGDTIQLYGNAGLYFLQEEGGDTSIFLGGRGGSELVGVVQGVTGLDLASDAFSYVDESTGLAPLGRAAVVSQPAAAKVDAAAAIVDSFAKSAAPEPAFAKLALDADAFTVTQASGAATLKAVLDGASGAANSSVTLSGSAQAFGTFAGDPFGLGEGLILSTGRVTDLPGANLVQSGKLTTTSIAVSFVKVGRVGDTDIYRADLSGLNIDLASLRINDSNSREGGSGGIASGFDLGAIALSTTKLDKAYFDANPNANLDDASVLPRLDVFDFSNASITYDPGAQRPADAFPNGPALLGSNINGLVSNPLARLDVFAPIVGSGGDTLTLGDGGSVAFDLKQTVSTKGPLYLYIGESGGVGETVIADLQISADTVAPSGDLSTDLGAAGLAGDATRLTYRFTPKAGDTAFSFDAVLFSEELPEYKGVDLSDLFSIKLNGIEIGTLSNGTSITLKSLVYSGSGDLIYNTVGSGPLADVIRADAYTKTLTISGALLAGQENVLTVEIKDGRDAFLDSGILIRDGSFRTFVKPTISVVAPPGGVSGAPGDPLQFDLTLPEGADPTAPVTVTVDPSDEIDLGAGAGNPITVTFVPGGPKTVGVDGTVSPGADPAQDGTITYTVESDDPAIDGQAIAPVVGDIVPPVEAGDPSLLFTRLGGDVAPGFTNGNDSVNVAGRPGPTTLYVAGLTSGKDVIAGFGRNDILVVDEKIYDSNNDGIITFGKNGLLDFDGPDKGIDTVFFQNVPKSLRLLGTDGEGHFAYADQTTRLAGWREGTLADDLLAADVGDRKAETFLFDTALDVDWGSDTITNFGARDRIVTTSRLYDGNNDGRVEFGSSGSLALSGSGLIDPSHLGDLSATRPFGDLAVKTAGGTSPFSLTLLSTQVQNDVTYYFYGLESEGGSFTTKAYGGGAHM